MEEGRLARVEVLPEEIARLHAILVEVAPAFRLLGYAEVEVDPRGYRTGALNEMIVRTRAH
jgi:PP-loop superfamily ATP-utilizing enzyme